LSSSAFSAVVQSEGVASSVQKHRFDAPMHGGRMMSARKGVVSSRRTISRLASLAGTALVLVAAQSCRPPQSRLLLLRGPMLMTVDSTFRSATQVKCAGVAALPDDLHVPLRSCFASAGDTIAYVYADTLGYIALVGREWSVPADRATAVADSVAAALSRQYGKSITCNYFDSSRTTHRVWVADSTSVAVILDLPPRGLDLMPTINVVRRTAGASCTGWLLKPFMG